MDSYEYIWKFNNSNRELVSLVSIIFCLSCTRSDRVSWDDDPCRAAFSRDLFLDQSCRTWGTIGSLSHLPAGLGVICHGGGGARPGRRIFKRQRALPPGVFLWLLDALSRWAYAAAAERAWKDELHSNPLHRRRTGQRIGALTGASCRPECCCGWSGWVYPSIRFGGQPRGSDVSCVLCVS